MEGDSGIRLDFFEGIFAYIGSRAFTFHQGEHLHFQFSKKVKKRSNLLVILNPLDVVYNGFLFLLLSH